MVAKLVEKFKEIYGQTEDYPRLLRAGTCKSDRRAHRL